MKKLRLLPGTGIIIALAALIVAGVSAPACAEGLTKIAEGVFSYVDAKNPTPLTSFGANAGIIVGTDGVVVVDTLTSAKEAKRFIRDIRSITGKPVKYVINTHHHLDHTLGNSEFAKRGAVIIAQEACKTEALKDADTILTRALNYGFTKEALAGTTVVLPSLTFTDRMTIDLGGRTVELISTGLSHTDGSAIVFVPDVKVLFAGDTLFTNYHPNVRDANIEGWIKALDRIAGMDAQKIIPGHGPVSTRQDIADMKSYLQVFDAKARELSARTNDADAVAAELKKALPKREYFEMFIAAGVKAKYLKK
ncbi:MAG TPA: MBL fold metallo-hydrolase [Nitrospirota bacterium]|nr:MBL fold metallo-hydrolase [Nitrospirota bacterium]